MWRRWVAATAVLAVIAVGGVLAASGGAGASGGALPPAEQVLAAKAQQDAAHSAWVAQNAVPWRAPKTGPAAPTSCPVALPQPTVHPPMVGGHDGLATRLSQGATSAAGVAYYFTSGSAARAPGTGALFVLRDGPDPCRGLGSQTRFYTVPGGHGAVSVLQVTGTVLVLRSADGSSQTLDLATAVIR